MALYDKGMPKKEGTPPQNVGGMDVQIATGLLSVALMEQGLEAVKEGAAQANPITPLSSILTMMMKELIPQLEQNGMSLDPNVWLADGGAVDQSIDLMGNMVGGLPEEVKNGVFMEVVDQLKLLSNKANQGGPPQGQSVPQPQGGEGMGPPGNSGAPPQAIQPPMGGV